jgi:hypothetical protein
MNDLRTALLPDDPAQDVVDRSRHRLQNHIRGGVPMARKRSGWLLAGVGVTVAAVAIAVLPSESPRTVTGQEVLLAAATAAAQTPEDSGTYWHVTIASGQDLPYEYWVKADGDMWVRTTRTEIAHRPPLPGESRNPFSLVGVVDLTLEQLRALPTDPEALKAWIADALAGSDTTVDRGYALFESLISLVSTLPAPPDVRAAAFRAVASYPDVKNLGEVPGGQGLLVYGSWRLVVNPDTGRVNRTWVFATMDGGPVFLGVDPSGMTITAEWTDTLPS